MKTFRRQVMACLTATAYLLTFCLLPGCADDAPRNRVAAASYYPTARSTGEAGYVYSPFGSHRVIDVHGMSIGALCRDPSTNRIFVIPGDAYYQRQVASEDAADHDSPPPDEQKTNWGPILLGGLVIAGLVALASSGSSSGSSSASSDDEADRQRQEQNDRATFYEQRRMERENYEAEQRGDYKPHPGVAARP